jgi:anaerobic selenocysteine-containing dehydrogenase
MHNCPSLMSGRDRFLILMNPLDAQKKSIADGQQVRVKTSNAQIELEAKLSAEMMPGVISIPHGWGHEGKGTQQKIALENKGGNLNALGDDLAIDPVSGNADLHIRNVEVYPI